MNCLSVVLLVLVLVCTATDLVYGKIYNRILILFLIAGVFLRLLQGGTQELPAILASILVPLLVLYPFWLLTGGQGLGGGDIKLLVVVSACVPLDVMLMIAMVSFGSALLAGFLKIFRRHIQYRRIHADGERSVKTQILSGRQTGMHLAFYIAFGVLLHVGGMY